MSESKKYLESSKAEDVYITRNGKIFAKISNPYSGKLAILRSLKGSIPSEMSEDEVEEERTKNI